jgi:hypothetical protein
MGTCKCNKNYCTNLPLGLKRLKSTKIYVPKFQVPKILINVDIDINIAIQSDILSLSIIRVILTHLENLRSNFFKHRKTAIYIYTFASSLLYLSVLFNDASTPPARYQKIYLQQTWSTQRIIWHSILVFTTNPACTALGTIRCDDEKLISPERFS